MRQLNFLDQLLEATMKWQAGPGRKNGVRQEKPEITSMKQIFGRARPKDVVVMAKKRGIPVNVSIAKGGEDVDTLVNGNFETKNKANAGDYIVSHTNKKGLNRYVVPGAEVAAGRRIRIIPGTEDSPQYETVPTPMYATRLRKGRTTITPPWGGTQSAQRGGMAMATVGNLSDAYLNANERQGGTLGDYEVIRKVPRSEYQALVKGLRR